MFQLAKTKSQFLFKIKCQSKYYSWAENEYPTNTETISQQSQCLIDNKHTIIEILKEPQVCLIILYMCK